MVSPFYIEPAGGQVGSGLAGLGQVIRETRAAQEEKAAIEAQQQRQRDMAAAIFDAAQSKDADKWASVVQAYPEAAEMAMQGLGAAEKWQRDEIADFSLRALMLPPEQAIAEAERRVAVGTSQGRDMRDTQEFLDLMRADNVEDARFGAQVALASADPTKWEMYKDMTKEAEAPESFRALEARADAGGLAQGSPERAAFMLAGGTQQAGAAGNASAVTRPYDNGTVLQALPDGSVQVLAPDGRAVFGDERLEVLRKAREEQVEFAGARAAATAQGEGQERRLQSTIDKGLDAVQGVPILRRSLELLDEVQTGGMAAAGAKIRSAFGVQGADEAELSYNLGKSVLSQLKAVFGSAFTESEGERLERLEAGFGNSVAANRRILQQTLTLVERSANRAIDAAYESGDDRTAQEIESMLDFILTDDGGGQSGDIFKEADAIINSGGVN
jgi:hypothetical protein